jgi:hypothetical protein
MKEYKNLPEDAKLFTDSNIGIVGVPNGFGKQAAMIKALNQLYDQEKTKVIVVGHHPNGKTTCTADEYLDRKSRNTFDRSLPHLGTVGSLSEAPQLNQGSLSDSLEFLSSNIIHDPYKKFDDWDYTVSERYGIMGGETKSDRLQFKNRIKRNRKRNKNKKTHRK